MKNLITTLFLVFVIIVTNTTNQLYSILLLTAGIILIFWLLFNLLVMRKEINLLKEQNQYVMDSFHDILTPVTLVHTFLKTACDSNFSENIRKELFMSVRNMNSLNDHLTRLMILKKQFTCSSEMELTEYELGAFLRSRVLAMREFAASRHITLEIKSDFSYASVRVDQSKIIPVIDKFIKNAITCRETGMGIELFISINENTWSIKISDSGDHKLISCYRCKKHQLLKHAVELEHCFVGSLLCHKLIGLCNGKILVDRENHTVSLQFPVINPSAGPSEHSVIRITKTPAEHNIDNLFRKTSQRRISDKPEVVLLDSNDDFRCYLEAHLSDEYLIKSFVNGAVAFAYIKEEYPDLVVSNTVLEGMSGEELSSRLKTSRETSVIPIILYGSSVDTDNRYKRQASLADSYLLTPFHIEDLKIEMSVLISNSRLLRKSFLQSIFGEKFINIPDADNGNSANHVFINQVKEFILENIDNEDFLIKHIAEKFNVSRTSFFNKWKSLTGESPKCIIHRIRMEKARELLESGKYAVSVIPEMIGLRSEKNFRKEYKKYFKMTPCESITKI